MAAVAAVGVGLLAVGDVIVFVADDGVHGMELWTHNPQTSTTSLLLDIQPNTAWGVPGTLVNGPGGMVSICCECVLPVVWGAAVC